MDAAQVVQAFAQVQQRYARTPCRECRGTQTTPLVYEGAVVVSCTACGGATRVGQLVRTSEPG